MQAQEPGHVRISGHHRPMALHMHHKHDICDTSCSAPIAYGQFISTCLGATSFPLVQGFWGSSWQLKNYCKARVPHIFLLLFHKVSHEWKINDSQDMSSTILSTYEQRVFYLFTYYMHLRTTVAYNKASERQLHSLYHEIFFKIRLAGHRFMYSKFINT